MKNKEKKTLLVIILTLITMAAEIGFGYLSNSMALLADGWHMGTHAFALSITFFAYIMIRKFADSEKLAFGSGKFSPLAGFASAILLGLSGLWILYESAERFFTPLQINFNEAITVAIIGLAVNTACILIMGGHEHGHGHKNSAECGAHEHKYEDYNFKSAYLHILADALTSVMAIAALLLGKYAGLNFLDSIVGLLGGIMICVWALGLIKSTAKILTDYEAEPLKTAALEKLKESGLKTDYLHIWDTGEDNYAAALKYSGGKSAEEAKRIIGELGDFVFINAEKTI